MQTLTLECDRCHKKASGKAEGRFWHRLTLRYPDADSIPASTRTHEFDFCSKDCLREFVKEMRGA